MVVLSVYKTQQLLTKPANVVCKNNLLRFFLMDERVIVEKSMKLVQ